MASSTKTSTQVDVAYLNNANRVTYDDESTMELYTKALIDDKSLSLIFFGDSQFDRISDEDLIQQMKNFADKEQTKRYMNIKGHEDLDYHLYRFYPGDADSVKEFGNLMSRIVMCQPLPGQMKYAEELGNTKFTEYASWNGDRYDVKLSILIRLAANIYKHRLTPRIIRQLSNIVIKYDGPEWKLGQHIEDKTHGHIKASTFNFQNNLAKWSDGHIDWAKIAKSKIDESSEKQVPPALKKEMARFGLDIIFDESVASDEYREWSDEDCENLVDYNFNDVLGTMIIGRNGMLLSELKARDIVRRLYPYTSARATQIADLRKYTPAERDITSARLASLVIVGPKRIRPEDWPTVRYSFPVPDKEKNVGKDPLKTDELEYKKVDLLDYIKETESFLPPYFTDFFEHFRGKDTRDKFDDKKVKQSQPITHKTTINIPYYRNNKPIDSFFTASTGGMHGSTCANLHTKSEEEIKTWIRTSEGTGAKGANKFTVDVQNIGHADWSSFYPMMASKMEIYKTTEGIDRYSGVMYYRFEVKEEAGRLWKAGLGDSPEFLETEDLQLGLKLILNAATGAGNMHSKYGLLPIDNKTLSMRLIGNMLIWALGQRLVQAGAFIISTNTDGLFYMNISEEKAEEVINGYVKDYGMPVDPEKVKRFINRDTSNRMEFDKEIDEVSRIGGSLRHGIGLEFDRRSLGENITYPLVSGNAAIHYMADDPDWLTKPYDRTRLRKFIEDRLKEDHYNAWYHVHVGTASRRLTRNGVRQQKINRVIMTQDGDKLGGENLSQLSKDHAITVWNAYVDDAVDNLNEIEFKDIDYYKWDNQLTDFSLELNDLKIDWVVKETVGRDKVYHPAKAELTHIKTFDEMYSTHGDSHTKKDLTDRSKAIADEFFEKIGTKVLGYYHADRDEWLPLKYWKASSKIANYPAAIGFALNTTAELEAFDKSKINIDAYVDWAEEQLKHWKRTADVPELGMKKCDDTVVKGHVVKHLTKAETVIENLKELYTIEID